ncbi:MULTISPECIES: LysR family transcriptional regulator [Pseudoalteromonas]|uniref:LysR family transcriptional regulator n=1 Tax=Pseudoalteromonas fuliginea TaxID=1872678 RepID=A0ABD3Y6T1_9GAMM|nr:MULTISPECIES: LysR family transcriptional regulator [Pseudoalteromonas]KDC49861.1 LysR family transcriptional regulator [Pseudoalteromonas fuliginea]KJZ27411.1 LysR family transcriptional regulator [Pseudoalteromonas fuliginea]MDQ2045499.1 LysR family transcriptional regulator [Pseudoalteromonas sp. 20-92]
MRFEQLEQFVALGILRHFRQAAEQTQISTSALTRSIQTLEDEMGYELVKRSTRSVKLTQQGELFLDYAKNTLSELELTKKLIFQSVSGKTGEKLIIGYTNKASNVVPISCGQFLAQYPHVKIEMQLQEEHELSRKLQLGEIDISVYSQAINSIGSDIHLPDQLILFVSKNHPLAQKNDISKHDLDSFPMYGCFSQSKQVQTMLNEAIDSLNKSSSIKVGSIEQVIAGLEKSDHFAIASIEHTNAVAEHSELIQLKTNKSLSHEQLVVQTNKQTAVNEHIDQLLSLIKKAATTIN